MAASARGLKRRLGFRLLTLHGVGVMVVAGIYVLVGAVAGEAWISAHLLLLVFLAINLALVRLKRRGPAPPDGFVASDWVPTAGAGPAALAMVWGVMT